MSKKTGDWKKSFRLRYGLDDDWDNQLYQTTPSGRRCVNDELVAFISDLLAKEKMELVERIEGMKVVGEYAPYTDERYHQDSYNQALDDIISALKSEEKEEVG